MSKFWILFHFVIISLQALHRVTETTLFETTWIGETASLYPNYFSNDIDEEDEEYMPKNCHEYAVQDGDSNWEYDYCSYEGQDYGVQDGDNNWEYDYYSDSDSSYNPPNSNEAESGSITPSKVQDSLPIIQLTPTSSSPTTTPLTSSSTPKDKFCTCFWIGLLTSLLFF